MSSGRGGDRQWNCSKGWILKVCQSLKYTLGRPLIRDVLLSIFYMLYGLLSCYCSYCEAQLVTGTSERKEKKTSLMRGRPRLYGMCVGRLCPRWDKADLFSARTALSETRPDQLVQWGRFGTQSVRLSTYWGSAGLFSPHRRTQGRSFEWMQVPVTDRQIRH